MKRYECRAKVLHNFLSTRHYSGKITATSSIDAAIAFEEKLLNDGKIQHYEVLDTYIQVDIDLKDTRLVEPGK
jgi:hypothetical protein